MDDAADRGHRWPSFQLFPRAHGGGPDGVENPDDADATTYAVIGDENAHALLSHAYPPRENFVLVRRVAATSDGAMRALMADLRVYADRNAGVTPKGLLMCPAVTHVQPPPGLSASAVYACFASS